jgi:NAD(P)-dependent dehydrogenase (short-subunit alcohol dehydrogenase family)
MAAEMTGRVCVITGASRGIGKASAEALASLGARLILVCRRQADGDKVASEISGPQTWLPRVRSGGRPPSSATFTLRSMCWSTTRESFTAGES